MGVTFLPQLYVTSEIDPREAAVVALPMARSSFNRTVGLVWRKGSGARLIYDRIADEIVEISRKRFGKLLQVRRRTGALTIPTDSVSLSVRAQPPHSGKPGRHPSRRSLPCANTPFPRRRTRGAPRRPTGSRTCGRSSSTAPARPKAGSRRSSTDWSAGHERALAAPPEAEAIPVHDARALTEGTDRARIVLDGKVYDLRITRAGKLILTK